MRRFFRLLRAGLGFNFRRMFTFRASFIMDFFSLGPYYLVDFVLIWVMVSAFDTMNGWTPFEVLFLYSISVTAYAFGGMFFYFVRWKTLRDIVSGDFDDVLLKPINPLMYIVIRNVNWGFVTQFTFSVIMLGICVANLGLQISVVTVLHLLGIAICGGAIYGAMFLLCTAPAFMMTKADNIGSIMFYFSETSRYPLSIFPRFIQVIMTVILPFAMMNFFPVQPLLGKHDYLMFGEYIVWLAPLITAVFFAIAFWFFNFSVKRYKSTGS